MKGGQIIRTRMVKNNGHAHALPQRIIDELSKFDKPVPGKILSDRLRVDLERVRITISLINHRKKSNVKILSVGKRGNTAYKIIDKKALNTDIKDNYDKRHKRAIKQLGMSTDMFLVARETRANAEEKEQLINRILQTTAETWQQISTQMRTD
jgi:hypothetical protein